MTDRGTHFMEDQVDVALRILPRHSTDTGGSAYLVHVSHAAQGIAMGKCNAALITQRWT